MTVAGVILAAGRSTRMGGGASKLLLPWGPDGKPIVATVAATLRAAGLQRVVAVLGHQAGPVADALASTGVETVRNPEHERGLSTSIASGVRAAGDADGWLFALGDMPAVCAPTVRALLDAFAAAASPAIAVPVCGGRRGNPVLFGAAWREELLGLQGDRGAKGLLAAHAGSVVEVPVADEGILADVDTAAGYRQLLEGRPPTLPPRTGADGRRADPVVGDG